MALIEITEGGPEGRLVRDRDGRKLGTLERVHGGPGRPSWGTLKPRRFGKRRLIPLADAHREGEEIRIGATRSEVNAAPRTDASAVLSPEDEDRLRRHYADAATRSSAAPVRPATGRRRTMAVPRSRGAVSGLLLLVLGIWGGLSPLVGPYFGYAFDQDDAWRTSTDMVWLTFLPAAAVVLGALVLIAGKNRVSAGLGAWLALAGGAWFLIGPTFSLLWDGGGPGAPIGQPLGGEGLRATELLWSFYALGFLVTALAAFALGRLATVSVRDLEVAQEGRRG